MQHAALVDRAGAWFLHSGIQEPEGGVARYYRADFGANAPVSTEITGYALSALVWLYRRTGDQAYRDAASRAARFLTRAAWKPEYGVFPYEYCASNGARPLAPAYFFDCGIIVRGLLAWWRESRDAEALDVAVSCGEGMARRFRGEGCIHPVVNLPDCGVAPYEPRWSRSPGCYQLKAALGWLELAMATRRGDFRSLYEDAADEAVASHREFLPGDPNPEKVMDRLHAYCYFLEGLAPAARGYSTRRRAIVEGIDRTAALLREIGPAFARSDVYAQLLRVRLYANAPGLAPLDEAAAREEAAAIPAFQSDSAERRLAGGFLFGCKRGEPLPFSNPVSTAFCLQAWDFWMQHQAGDFDASVSDLI